MAGAWFLFTGTLPQPITWPASSTASAESRPKYGLAERALRLPVLPEKPWLSPCLWEGEQRRPGHKGSLGNGYSQARVATDIPLF